MLSPPVPPLSNFLNSDLADRVVVLNYGAKIADGPPHEVTAQSEVLAAYLGGPAALGASRL
jgi:ABC-type uncharacterized transport system ATPase subunit